MALPYLANVGAGLRRTLGDTTPSVTHDPFQMSRGYHRMLRLLFENELFDDAQLWQTYKSHYRLPRSIRGIFNPTRRAVEWHAGRIYSGAWTDDGRPLPDGTPHALQFPSDIITDRPDLVLASLQVLNWGNWQAMRTVYVREAAIVGTAFVEMVDDLERRKVYPEIVPIERLSAVTLDATGNVKAYELSYQARDPDTGHAYAYRKTVDSDEIVEYRDRTVTRRDDNPYGFVPAALVKHRNTGSAFGAPAIAGVIPKIEEINRLATSVHNYIGKLQKQPVVFYGRDAPVPVTKAGASDADAVGADTESVAWLHSTDANGKVVNMMQPVPIDGAGIRIDKLMEEIEADLPELTLDRELRSMQNVTGPGADRMLGDVRGRFDEVQANADAGTIKLIQMGVAIGGWRLSRGDWGPRSQVTRQQAKFDGFDLESFQRGDLDVSLIPRPLIPSTEQERLLALQLRKEVAGLSDDAARRALGYDDDEIAQLNTEVAAQTDRLAVGAF